MFELRDLRVLIALARHRHFARAANECSVSQPAFSMRIRRLEDRLGIPIVKRGNRFQGFTEEGEALVRHAREILENVDALEQTLRSKAGVSGQLALGVIPTAVAAAARLASALHAAFPKIRVQIETVTSAAVLKGLEDGTFDAGISYGDTGRRDMLVIDPLYDERYVLLVPLTLAPRQSGVATWAEAARLPLCLLEPGMQNRRILDRVLAGTGIAPEIVAETTELASTMVTARHGLAATILPEVLIEELGCPIGTIALPLGEPALENSIVLMTLAGGGAPAEIEALRTCVAQEFDKHR